MVYKLIEEEYYYRPIPEDADQNNDPVVWKNKTEKEMSSLTEIFSELKAFTMIWEDTKMQISDDWIIVSSNAASEDSNHPDHYFTNRHSMTVMIEEEIE